jgi:lipoate-protein ligase B
MTLYWYQALVTVYDSERGGTTAWLGPGNRAAW